MYFVSYSRKQFHFAEYLVGELEKRGLEVWFDVQELKVGVDWQENLQRGLNECRGLILVASPSSITSPYVTEEWQHALERGIPIYVIVFEPVQLPDALCNAAHSVVYFVQSLPQLLDALASNRTPLRATCRNITLKDSIKWISRDVWLVSLTLFVSMLFHVSGALMVNWPGVASRLVLQTVFASLGLFMAYQSWQFLRRDFSYEQLFNGLIVFNGVGLLSYTQLIFPGDSRLPNTHQIVYLLSALVVPLTLYSLYALLRSWQLLIWLPTGEAPLLLRRNFNPRLSRESQSSFNWREVITSKPAKGASRRHPLTPVLPPEKRKSFQLHHHPADTPVARRIWDVLTRVGHRHVDAEAEHHLILVSNFADVDWMATVLQDYPRFIPIVITSVEVPPELESLKRCQWVDYRAQADIQLEGLLDLFAENERLATKKLNNIPEGMSRTVLPASVQWFVLALRITAAVLLIMSGILGLSAAYNLPNSSAIAYLGLVAAVYQFWLVERVIRRHINQTLVMVTLLATWVLNIAAIPALWFLTLIPLTIFVLLLASEGGNAFVLNRVTPWFPSHPSIKPVNVNVGVKHDRSFTGFNRNASVVSGKRLAVTAAFLHSRQSMDNVRTAPIWKINGVFALLAMWLTIYLPRLEVAGMFELFAYQAGLTRQQDISLDQTLSFDIPEYFQVKDEFETPAHLREIGQTIWQARSVLGLSAQNSVTISVLRYDPADPDIIRTSYSLQTPLMLIGTGMVAPQRVPLPLSDPAATVQHFLDQDFRPLVEQIYAPYYDALDTNAMAMEYQQRQADRNADAGIPSISPMIIMPVHVNVTGEPLPASRNYSVTVLSDAVLDSDLDNMVVNHFVYDVTLEDGVSHEWLYTLQTFGADYLVHITGSETNIRWHLSEIEDLVGSQFIPDDFRQALDDTVRVGNLLFTVPTEINASDTSGAAGMLVGKMFNTGEDAINLDAALYEGMTIHWHGYYLNPSRRVRIMTLAPESSYGNSAEMLSAIQNYVHTNDHASVFLRLRVEFPDDIARQATGVTRRTFFDSLEQSSGTTAHGIHYERLSITTKFGSTDAAVLGKQFGHDDLVYLNHGDDQIFVWFSEPPEGYVESFLANVRITDAHATGEEQFP